MRPTPAKPSRSPSAATPISTLHAAHHQVPQGFSGCHSCLSLHKPSWTRRCPRQKKEPAALAWEEGRLNSLRFANSVTLGTSSIFLDYSLLSLKNTVETSRQGVAKMKSQVECVTGERKPPESYDFRFLSVSAETVALYKAHSEALESPEQNLVVLTLPHCNSTLAEL